MNGDIISLPKVSILILNYNGLRFLEELLDSIIRLNYLKDRYEIIFIDNDSKDESLRFVNDKYHEYILNRNPLIKIFKLDKNYGFAEGNNKGVKYCTGEYIALINNDTVVDENWLIELIGAAKKYPYAIYSSKMLWYTNKEIILNGGMKLLKWGWPMHLWLWQRNENDHRIQPEKIFFADGCGFLIPKELYLELEGFDNSYFAYAEDYELSWKARLLGYEIYFVPTAKFYHKISMTGGEFSEFHIYHLYRNHLRNIIKFAEFYTMTYMVPFFLMHGIMTYLVIHVYRERRPKLIIPLLRSYIDPILEISKLNRSRKIYQTKRKIRDAEFKDKCLIMPFIDSIKEIFDSMNRRKNRLGNNEN